MVDSEDGDTPAPLQVTAARDAYIAGRDVHLHMPSPMKSDDEDGPDASFIGAADVQVGSGNVQVNNYYGQPPLATEDPQRVHRPGLDGLPETTGPLDQAERWEADSPYAAATFVGPRPSSFPARLAQRVVTLSDGLRPGTLLAIEVRAHRELEQATVVITDIAGPPGAAAIPPPARLYWHPSREVSATIAQGASGLVNVSRAGPLPTGAIMDTPDQDLPWSLPNGKWQVELQLTARRYPALNLVALFRVSPADGFPVQRIEWLTLTRT